MRWIRSNRTFAALCTLIILGVAPIAYLMGWNFYGNSNPVSMRIPVRPGTYSSPWFTTRIDDLYELDLITNPARQNPIDFDWQVVDASNNILASGMRQEAVFRAYSITLARYQPKPGLRQRVVINVTHGATGSEQVPTLSLYSPEACLRSAYEAPVYALWAIVLLSAAVALFVVSFGQLFFHHSRSVLS
jgi:hypothetical protein